MNLNTCCNNRTWYYNGLITAVQEADREPQEGACLNEELVRSPGAWNRG